jgi:hypothetical protein
VYTTCLFCTRPLGTNEVIERFPVGRRVAFDGATGRLWVVCPHCERWNLTPMEERWEAIEQAERLYRDTRLRVSTDNIGLARLPEGLELVRIGRPQRPEIAAWRYGDQFGRRRHKHFMTAGMVVAGGVVVGGLATVIGMTAGVGGFMAMNIGRVAFATAYSRLHNRTVASLRDDAGQVIHVERKHLSETTIVLGNDGTLALEVQHTRGRVGIEGAEARRAAAVLFPAANQGGGTKRDVQLAVTRLVDAGGAEAYLRQITRQSERQSRIDEKGRRILGEESGFPASGLLALPISARLAIEMALHEEQERRALEGELAELEQAWREAEEIGAIADSLLLPSWIDETIKRFRAPHA